MATAHPIQSGDAAGSNFSALHERNNDNPRSLGSMDGPNAGAAGGTSTLVMSGPSGMEGTSQLFPEEDLRLSPSMSRMPVALAVAVPVRDFRVRNLLAMTLGDVIETRWGNGDDLPLSSADVQLAWTEFEVVETRLAVRVTRLA